LLRCVQVIKKTSNHTRWDDVTWQQPKSFLSDVSKLPLTPRHDVQFSQKSPKRQWQVSLHLLCPRLLPDTIYAKLPRKLIPYTHHWSSNYNAETKISNITHFRLKINRFRNQHELFGPNIHSLSATEHLKPWKANAKRWSQLRVRMCSKDFSFTSNLHYFVSLFALFFHKLFACTSFDATPPLRVCVWERSDKWSIHLLQLAAVRWSQRLRSSIGGNAVRQKQNALVSLNSENYALVNALFTCRTICFHTSNTVLLRFFHRYIFSRFSLLCKTAGNLNTNIKPDISPASFALNAQRTRGSKYFDSHSSINGKISWKFQCGKTCWRLVNLLINDGFRGLVLPNYRDLRGKFNVYWQSRNFVVAVNSCTILYVN